MLHPLVTLMLCSLTSSAAGGSVDGGNSTTATPRVYCAVNLTQSDPEECTNLFTDKENLCTGTSKMTPNCVRGRYLV